MLKLTDYTTREGAGNAKLVASTRWLLLLLASGAVLAITQLVSSISTYITVSHWVVVDHLRSDLHSQAALIETEARQNSIQQRAQLSAILQQVRENSKGRVAWIAVRNAKGEVLSEAGSPVGHLFSTQDVRSHLQSRQALFKTIVSSQGEVLVEVLPFMLPPGPMRPALSEHSGTSGGPMATVEIGELWAGADVALWSVRRHLIVNSSAALVLLMALTTIALRLRPYLAGRQLAQEIEIARSVQRDLLPCAKSELDGFEVAADFLPFAGVSGDFYDTFSPSGERAAFVLGDVAGKGIPAALLMGVLHGTVRSSNWTESPRAHREATSQMNRLLYERASTARFASMFWSYFDPQSEYLRYINAGHCPPLLIKGNQRIPPLRLTCGGPVLGLLAGAEFQQGTVRLDIGDCLVLYSDGVVEATNSADEEFGEERLAELVRTHREETAEAIRDHILAALDGFTGSSSPHDDRTLLVAVYSGAAGQRAERRDVRDCAKPATAAA